MEIVAEQSRNGSCVRLSLWNEAGAGAFLAEHRTVRFWFSSQFKFHAWADAVSLGGMLAVVAILVRFIHISILSESVSGCEQKRLHDA